MRVVSFVKLIFLDPFEPKTRFQLGNMKSMCLLTSNYRKFQNIDLNKLSIHYRRPISSSLWRTLWTQTLKPPNPLHHPSRRTGVKWSAMRTLTSLEKPTLTASLRSITLHWSCSTLHVSTSLWKWCVEI